MGKDRTVNGPILGLSESLYPYHWVVNQTFCEWRLGFLVKTRMTQNLGHHPIAISTGFQPYKSALTH